MVPWYDFTFTQCIRIQIFSSITLYVAPGDGFLGTHRTVIWNCHSMNLNVVLSVVCGCMVFAIYIPNINLITIINMSLCYIFYVASHVTFFTLFLILQVFFFINLTAIMKMVMSDILTWFGLVWYFCSDSRHVCSRCGKQPCKLPWPLIGAPRQQIVAVPYFGSIKDDL